MFLVILFIAYVLSGCAVVQSPVSSGLLFTEVSGPGEATANGAAVPVYS